jgi:hypothetical protein
MATALGTEVQLVVDFPVTKALGTEVQLIADFTPTKALGTEVQIESLSFTLASTFDALFLAGD